jgi:hypothetical protein
VTSGPSNKELVNCSLYLKETHNGSDGEKPHKRSYLMLEIKEMAARAMIIYTT